MLLAIGMSGFLVNPAGSNRLCENLLTKTSSGTPYCRPIEIAVPKHVHQAADRRAFLGHRDEQLAGPAVGIEADGDVALVARDVELVGDELAACRAAARARGLASDGLLPSLVLVAFGASVD